MADGPRSKQRSSQPKPSLFTRSILDETPTTSPGDLKVPAAIPASGPTTSTGAAATTRVANTARNTSISGLVAFTPPSATLRPSWPRSEILQGLLGGAAWIAGRIGAESSEVEKTLDAVGLPERELRIGLKLKEADATAFVHAPGHEPTRFFIVPDGETDDRACERYTLDAIVNRAGKLLRITTLNRGEKRAAWTDWGMERDLSFASVFPSRFDCASVTILEGDDEQTRWDHVRLICETAAVLSRHPSRLTAADRLQGRRPLELKGKKPREFGEYRATRDRGRDAIARVLATLNELPEHSTPTAAERVLARLASAEAATAGRTMDERVRRRCAEAAARVAADEAEVMLRLAAVRLGAMDDLGGLDALERAGRMLRDRPPVGGLDQFAFINAELELGPDEPMAVGRIAAGICLICASLSPTKIAYLRDDLMDDIRYCGKLVGRDQDRRLLLQVFRMLERERRAETLGLPGKAGRGKRKAA
jgi:hypothetical protein